MKALRLGAGGIFHEQEDGEPAWLEEGMEEGSRWAVGISIMEQGRVART